MCRVVRSGLERIGWSKKVKEPSARDQHASRGQRQSLSCSSVRLAPSAGPAHRPSPQTLAAITSAARTMHLILFVSFNCAFPCQLQDWCTCTFHIIFTVNLFFLDFREQKIISTRGQDRGRAICLVAWSRGLGQNRDASRVG